MAPDRRARRRISNATPTQSPGQPCPPHSNPSPAARFSPCSSPPPQPPSLSPSLTHAAPHPPRPPRLFWKRPDGSRYATFAALDADHPLAFATNAGIFDPTFTPCGLHAADGRELVPLNTRDGPGNFYLRPNGVFVIDDDHGPRIVESGKYTGTTRRTRLATQSGPMLVIDGALHPQFAPDSQNRRTRSGVGVRAADRAVVFALSREPVTFHEFATLFQQRLACPDALYLDGEISRFYTPGDPSPPDGNFAGILAVTAR